MQTGFSPINVSAPSRPRFGSMTNEQAAESFIQNWLDNFGKTKLDTVQLHNNGSRILVEFNNETYRLDEDGRDPYSTAPAYVELVRVSTGETVLSYTGQGCFSPETVHYLGGNPIYDAQLTRKTWDLFEKIRNLVPNQP